MNFEVITFEAFRKEAKRLSKKYPSLKDEIGALILMLVQKPDSGDHIGGSFYKIRLAIASKGRGKSGGGRVITFVYFTGSIVLVLDLIDKSEYSTVDIAAYCSIVQDYLESDQQEPLPPKQFID